MLLGATGTRSRRERPANEYDDAATMIRAGAKRDRVDAVPRWPQRPFQSGYLGR